MLSRYDDIFQEILYEGQNEVRADSLVKKSYKEYVKDLEASEEEMLLGTIEEQYEKLKEEIKEIGIGYPESKNMRHLPQLVRYFIESNYQSKVIIDLYRRYLESPLRSKDVIMSIDSLEEFETEISYIEEITPSEEEIDNREEIVYEDRDIVVRYGKDKKSCIVLGKGTRYGFCISRSGSSNLFLGYRSKGASFYFIEFKNEESKGEHPEIETLVIHVYPGDNYMATFGVPGKTNSDFETTPSDLINEFPSLEDAFSSGIFKEVPPSEDEKYVLDIQDKINNGYEIIDFYRPRDRIVYIQLGGVIDYDAAGWLHKKDPSRYKDYIDTYIENYTSDIDDRLLDSELITPKQKNRYNEKLQQRLDIKLSQDISLTNHERTYALDHMDLTKVTDTVKYNIVNSYPLGTTKEDIRTSLQYLYDIYDNKRYFVWQFMTSIIRIPNVLEESVIKEEEDWIKDVLMKYAETVYTEKSEEPLYSAWISFRDTDVSFYNILKLLRVGLAVLAYEAIYKGQEIDFLDEFELSSRPDLYKANDLLLLLRWTDNTTQITPKEVEDTIIEFSKLSTRNLNGILDPSVLDFNFIKFSPFLASKLRDIVLYNVDLSESRKEELIEMIDTYSDEDSDDIEEPGPRQRSLTESLIRKTIEIYWNAPE